MALHKFIVAEVRQVQSIVCCLGKCIISFMWPPIITKNASIDVPVGIIVI